MLAAAAPTLPSRCRVPSPQLLCPPAPGLGVLEKDEPLGPTFPCWNWSSGGQDSQQEGRKGLGLCKWRRLSGFQHLCFGKETPHPDAALHIIPSRVFLLLLPLPFDTLPGSLVLCLGLLSGLSDQLVLSFSFSLYFP